MFLFRLALSLGSTVERLEQELSPSEFTEWLAYFQLEPFGAWRDNWHSAQLAALLYNIHRGKQPSISAKDFMYRDLDTDREENTRQFIAGLKAQAKPKDG